MAVGALATPWACAEKRRSRSYLGAVFLTFARRVVLRASMIRRRLQMLVFDGYARISARRISHAAPFDYLLYRAPASCWPYLISAPLRGVS